ncbi:hypothetical protein BD413DRAFT_94000 [Trametes elegans]|nr:hypothetical protein BD413DRAFT_94000 [Trametes elegans]
MSFRSTCSLEHNYSYAYIDISHQGGLHYSVTPDLVAALCFQISYGLQQARASPLHSMHALADFCSWPTLGITNSHHGSVNTSRQKPWCDFALSHLTPTTATFKPPILKANCVTVKTSRLSSTCSIPRSCLITYRASRWYHDIALAIAITLEWLALDSDR